MHRLRYANKVVLVTGGASGIGRAITQGFADEDATVVFTDIAQAAGTAFEQELLASGAEARFVMSDASSEPQVQALIARIVERYGRLDVAVNNVGGMAPGNRSGQKLHDTTLEAWDAGLRLNLTSAFLCMKHEIAQMLQQGGGVIANTASMAGMRYTPHGAPSYDAAKAGLIHLSATAAVAYAAHDIRINVVAPGLTLTPLIEQGFTPEQRSAMASAFQPMNRMMQPQEIADAFLWLCSDEASAVTGLAVPVSGGWAAR